MAVAFVFALAVAFVLAFPPVIPEGNLLLARHGFWSLP
jgi:hypothetical protein